MYNEFGIIDTSSKFLIVKGRNHMETLSFDNLENVSGGVGNETGGLWKVVCGSAVKGEKKTLCENNLFYNSDERKKNNVKIRDFSSKEEAEAVAQTFSEPDIRVEKRNGK